MKALLVAAALLLAGCAAPPRDPYAGRAPAGTQTQTLVVPRQQFAHPTFGAPSPVHARVTWNSSQRIDAWITGDFEHDCAGYGLRTFHPAAAMLNSTGGVLEADLPAGTDCLILDNADFAGGQAPAGPDATVSFTIDVWVRG